MEQALQQGHHGDVRQGVLRGTIREAIDGCRQVRFFLPDKIPQSSGGERKRKRAAVHQLLQVRRETHRQLDFSRWKGIALGQALQGLPEQHQQNVVCSPVVNGTFVNQATSDEFSLRRFRDQGAQQAVNALAVYESKSPGGGNVTMMWGHLCL